MRRILDAVVDLGGAERQRHIERLIRREPHPDAVVAELRALLAADEAARASGFLDGPRPWHRRSPVAPPTSAAPGSGARGLWR